MREVWLVFTSTADEELLLGIADTKINADKLITLYKKRYPKRQFLTERHEVFRG